MRSLREFHTSRALPPVFIVACYRISLLASVRLALAVDDLAVLGIGLGYLKMAWL